VVSERYVDPAVGQALEEVRDALRAERSSQEPQASQNAELRERAGRLEAERDQLRGELERLREGRPGRVPRLPEVLQVPFEVRPVVMLRRQVREALPMLMLVVLALSIVGRKSGSGVAIIVFAGVMLLVQLLMQWKGRSRWRFVEAGIEAKESEVQGGLVRYTDVLQVEAYSSRGQRLRGVGSVGVTFKAVTGEEKVLTLKDVPEPERLAQWLESKRSGAV
jgi:hypothetical protein